MATVNFEIGNKEFEVRFIRESGYSTTEKENLVATLLVARKTVELGECWNLEKERVDYDRR